jgi:hypothetical protein
VKTEADMIAEISKIFVLTEPELASLMHAARPAVQSRSAEVLSNEYGSQTEPIFRLAVLLSKEIELSRIPDIIRRKESWLNDRSMLEVLKAEGVAPIYAYLRRLFEYRE